MRKVQAAIPAASLRTAPVPPFAKASRLLGSDCLELYSVHATSAVDLNIIGSSYDGIELIRKINFEYGNGVVIGIISSSDEAEEQSKAIKAGAQFWIIKSDDIEPRLEEFRKDYKGYKNRTNPFKIYK